MRVDLFNDSAAREMHPSTVIDITLFQKRKVAKIIISQQQVT